MHLSFHENTCNQRLEWNWSGTCLEIGLLDGNKGKPINVTATKYSYLKRATGMQAKKNEIQAIIQMILVGFHCKNGAQHEKNVHL